MLLTYVTRARTIEYRKKLRLSGSEEPHAVKGGEKKNRGRSRPVVGFRGLSAMIGATQSYVVEPFPPVTRDPGGSRVWES